MPARDVYHVTVRTALVKDGWTITHDPYTLPFGDQKLQVDLGAEMPLGAEKDGRKIAVEVKSFLGASQTSDLQNALGQYLMYAFVLKRQDPDRTLWLAAPRDLCDSFQRSADTQRMLATYEVRLLAFDPVTEEVVAWIE